MVDGAWLEQATSRLSSERSSYGELPVVDPVVAAGLEPANLPHVKRTLFQLSYATIQYPLTVSNRRPAACNAAALPLS